MMTRLVLLIACSSSALEFRVPARDGYKLSIITSANTKTDDAVLLLHGRTWSSGPVWQTTGAIDTLGRAAYGLDFRGFGRTQKRAADGLLRPSTCVDDVCDVLTDLRTKHEKVHLLGWSYGGLVAQRVAASTDLVDRLVLYSSVWDETGDYADDNGRFKASVPRGPQTLEDCASDFNLPGSISAEDSDTFARAALAADPQCVDWTALSEFAVDLGDVTCPCLVIHGDQDPYASRETQRALCDALGSSSKQLVVIDGSDHVAHALTQPKVQWAGAIGAFLDA
jgi:pimeloyl-ACP methyl ester carboxylesterase